MEQTASPFTAEEALESLEHADSLYSKLQDLSRSIDEYASLDSAARDLVLVEDDTSKGASPKDFTQPTQGASFQTETGGERSSSPTFESRRSSSLQHATSIFSKLQSLSHRMDASAHLSKKEEAEEALKA